MNQSISSALSSLLTGFQHTARCSCCEALLDTNGTIETKEH